MQGVLPYSELTESVPLKEKDESLGALGFVFTDNDPMLERFYKTQVDFRSCGEACPSVDIHNNNVSDDVYNYIHENLVSKEPMQVDHQVALPRVRHIDISNTKCTEAAVTKILQFALEVKSLKWLSIANLGIKWTESNVGGLCSLVGIPGVTHVDVSGNYFTAEAADMLSKAIRERHYSCSPAEPQELILSNAGFGKQLPVLAEAIASQSGTVTMLDLSRSNIDNIQQPLDFGGWADPPRPIKNWPLRELRLSNVTNCPFPVIFEALTRHPSLEKLDVSSNALSDEDVTALCRVLCGPEKAASLRAVALSACFADGSDQASFTRKLCMLGNALSCDATSLAVDLSGNPLGHLAGDACECLFSGLARIHSVNLRNCQMGDDAITRLCEALKHRKVLTKLDISQNSCGIRGASAIAAFLNVVAQGRTSLLELNIEDCGITPAAGDSIFHTISSLHQQPHLSRLLRSFFYEGRRRDDPKRNEFGGS